MKNLHKINNEDIPVWAKRLILAFIKQNSFSFAIKKHWYYKRSLNVLNFDYETATETENRWILRGWKPYMDKVDVNKFPPKGLKLTIRP